MRLVIGVRRTIHATAASWRVVTPLLPAALALASIPTVITAVRGGDDFTGAFESGAIVVGASLALVVDDAAAVTLEASPTTLIERRLARLIPSVALVAAVLAVLGAAAQRWSSRPPRYDVVLVELAAAAGAALALAAAGRANGPVASGAAGAFGGLLVLAFVSALATRWTWLPAVTVPGRHTGWWYVTAAGLAAAMWSSLDPGRPSLRRRPHLHH